MRRRYQALSPALFLLFSAFPSVSKGIPQDALLSTDPCNTSWIYFCKCQSTCYQCFFVCIRSGRVRNDTFLGPLARPEAIGKETNSKQTSSLTLDLPRYHHLYLVTCLSLSLFENFCRPDLAFTLSAFHGLRLSFITIHHKQPRTYDTSSSSKHRRHTFRMLKFTLTVVGLAAAAHAQACDPLTSTLSFIFLRERN
jgi:hypothetical protein